MEWVEKDTMRVTFRGTSKRLPPLFSEEDMNITAMSKRRRLARLLRICSVKAGASFLQGSCHQYKL